MKSQTGISRDCSKMVVVVVNRDPGANLTSEQYGNYATYAWGGRGEALNFHNFRPGAQGSPIRICSRALTLRKLDHEPLLDAGMLLCGSLLELMAVGYIASTWRDSKRRTPKERKEERTSGQENENTIRIETTDVTVVWSMYQSEVCVVVRRGEGGG